MEKCLSAFSSGWVDRSYPICCTVHPSSLWSEAVRYFMSWLFGDSCCNNFYEYSELFILICRVYLFRRGLWTFRLCRGGCEECILFYHCINIICSANTFSQVATSSHTFAIVYCAYHYFGGCLLIVLSAPSNSKISSNSFKKRSMLSFHNWTPNTRLRNCADGFVVYFIKMSKRLRTQMATHVETEHVSSFWLGTTMTTALGGRLKNEKCMADHRHLRFLRFEMCVSN